MPMVRGMRLVNSMESGSICGACLESLLTSDTGRQSDFTGVLLQPGPTCVLAYSSPGMCSIAYSNTATTLVGCFSIPSTIITNSPVATCQLYSSPNAVGVLSCSVPYMTVVASSIPATCGMLACPCSQNAAWSSCIATCQLFNTCTSSSAIACTANFVTSLFGYPNTLLNALTCQCTLNYIANGPYFCCITNCQCALNTIISSNTAFNCVLRTTGNCLLCTAIPRTTIACSPITSNYLINNMTDCISYVVCDTSFWLPQISNTGSYTANNFLQNSLPMCCLSKSAAALCYLSGSHTFMCCLLNTCALFTSIPYWIPCFKWTSNTAVSMTSGYNAYYLCSCSTLTYGCSGSMVVIGNTPGQLTYLASPMSAYGFYCFAISTNGINWCTCGAAGNALCFGTNFCGTLGYNCGGFNYLPLVTTGNYVMAYTGICTGGPYYYMLPCFYCVVPGTTCFTPICGTGTQYGCFNTTCGVKVQTYGPQPYVSPSVTGCCNNFVVVEGAPVSCGGTLWYTCGGNPWSTTGCVCGYFFSPSNCGLYNIPNLPYSGMHSIIDNNVISASTGPMAAGAAATIGGACGWCITIFNPTCACQACCIPLANICMPYNICGCCCCGTITTRNTTCGNHVAIILYNVGNTGNVAGYITQQCGTCNYYMHWQFCSTLSQFISSASTCNFTSISCGPYCCGYYYAYLQSCLYTGCYAFSTGGSCTNGWICRVDNPTACVSLYLTNTFNGTTSTWCCAKLHYWSTNTWCCINLPPSMLACGYGCLNHVAPCFNGFILGNNYTGGSCCYPLYYDATSKCGYLLVQPGAAAGTPGSGFVCCGGIYCGQAIIVPTNMTGNNITVIAGYCCCYCCAYIAT